MEGVGGVGLEDWGWDEAVFFVITIIDDSYFQYFSDF